MQSLATANADVPVLIVSGGRAGLTASMLLADPGVRHLLVELSCCGNDGRGGAGWQGHRHGGRE